jgi:hypothetical protein
MLNVSGFEAGIQNRAFAGMIEFPANQRAGNVTRGGEGTARRDKACPHCPTFSPSAPLQKFVIRSGTL